MISREEYSEFVGKLVTDEDSQKYKESRRKTRKAYSIAFPIEVLLTFIALILVVNSGATGGVFVVLFFAFMAVMITIIIVQNKAGFKWGEFKAYKRVQIIDYLLKDYVHSFNPRGVIEQRYFRKSEFGDYYDDYMGEDLLEVDIPNDDGAPSGVKFNICDLHLTRTETYTDSDGNMHETTVTVYRGAFGYVSFPFNFKCRLGINNNLSGTKKIKLEDINFNKKIKITTDNQLEALMILTPAMMMKLKALNQKTGDIKFSIFDNYMFMGFDRMNLFEFKAARKTLKPEIFDNFYNDMETILMLVDEIKNNNKIFKM